MSLNRPPAPRAPRVAVVFSVFLSVVLLNSSTRGWQNPAPPRTAPPAQAEALETGRPDFERMERDQAETDARWRAASEGVMRMEKITYRSSRGDLTIPAFVFLPLQTRGAKQHPALVWVHENIRGHLYEHYIPYVRDAVAKGFVVFAPEYRGSIGYGRRFYDAIDY